MIPAEMFELPEGSVLSVIGAGGKTTAVHVLAAAYRARGWKVLVTTTTHMLREEGMKSDKEEILAALRQDGYVFAGTPVLRRGLPKMASLPEETLAAAIEAADISLIEADGAAGEPFKVPKATEPVIHPRTTNILLAAGMKAAGEKIGGVCYEADALCRIIGRNREDILTPEDMGDAYRKTYLTVLAKQHPDIPVTVFASQTETPEREEYGRRFLKRVQESS